MKKISVGIIGLGTVGGGVYKQLKKKRALIKKRAGISVSVKAVCDKNTKALKACGATKKEIVASYTAIIKDPSINCVVELVGGKTIAKKIILESLQNGKDVVTANKALLAEEGEQIFKTAHQYGRQIFYEASIGGGIPIVKSMRESFVSNNVSTVLSIINGTCNYILTQMSKEGMSFKDALALAQSKGYAEADPSFDIDGIDAAHKITLLAQLAFGKKVRFKDVSCEGITKIQQGDIAFADQLGYVVKLLAIAKRINDKIEVRVQPTLLAKNHILASVNDSYNAVFLTCDEVEDVLLYGRGAGEAPTASAVVSDIVDVARIQAGLAQELALPVLQPVRVRAMSAILSRYFLRFQVIDKPGVLAHIASILGKYEVSISDVIQQERKVGRAVPLVLLTHETTEKKIQDAVKRISTLSIIKGHSQVLRIEE